MPCAGACKCNIPQDEAHLHPSRRSQKLNTLAAGLRLRHSLQHASALGTPSRVATTSPAIRAGTLDTRQPNQTVRGLQSAVPLLAAPAVVPLAASGPEAAPLALLLGPQAAGNPALSSMTPRREASLRKMKAPVCKRHGGQQTHAG